MSDKEKALKSEDRHRQGLEIDPVKVLKSLGWKEERYHVDRDTKTIYVLGLDVFMDKLGVKLKTVSKSIKWQGWTWKRGGKDVF